jgi:hypothetical protein
MSMELRKENQIGDMYLSYKFNHLISLKIFCSLQASILLLNLNCYTLYPISCLRKRKTIKSGDKVLLLSFFKE